MESILSLLFAVFILIGIIILFVRIMQRIRRGGGSLPFLIASGTLDATLSKEQKAAVTMVVEQNAHKKMEEQSSYDPPEMNK